MENRLLKRLKNWENNKDRWIEDNKKLKYNILNEEKEKQQEFIEKLERIVKNSVEKYEKNNIKKYKQIELSKAEKEEFKNDIMFELQNNYPIVKGLDIKNNNVLNLSINPGSTQKGSQDENSKNGKEDIGMPLYSFDLDNLDKKNADNINEIIKEYGINEKYIWRKYYNPNFEIFKEIDAKYPWVALETEKFKEKLERILDAQIKYKKGKKDKNIKKLEESKENALNTFVDMHKKEREEYESNKNPLVFFNDLFWIADSNQNELLTFLKKNKDNLESFIKEIIDLYIEKYKLGLIVVTNAKAAEYVKAAIGDSKEDNCVYIYTYDKDNQKKEIPIIFSGYIANGMDQFSRARLKKEIKEYYTTYNKN